LTFQLQFQPQNETLTLKVGCQRLVFEVEFVIEVEIKNV